MKLTLVRNMATLAVLSLGGGGMAYAGSVNPFTDLGSAGPTYWGVLGLGGASCNSTCGSASTSVTVQAQSAVNGNIGVAPDGNLTFDTTSHGYGTADVDTGGTVSNGGQVSGGVTQNSSANSLLNTASEAALKAYTDASGMTATITNETNINNPSSPITITGGSGINVVNLSNLVIQSSSDGLILSAPSNGYFVINVSGNFTISNGASITVAGGLSAYDVLYNVTGSGGTVTFNGSNQNTVVDGIVLTAYNDIEVNGSLVNGEVIAGGGSIYVENDGDVTGQATSAPEPPTRVLMASGLAAGWWFRRWRKAGASRA
jgi:choice-of-anchor A domain-containing protein